MLTIIENVLAPTDLKAVVYAGAILFTLILALASWLVAGRLSRGLSRPVEELAAGLDRVATGQGPMHVEPAGSPEVRALIESFNRMTVDLAESKAELARSARMAAWQDAARRIAQSLRTGKFRPSMAILRWWRSSVHG